MKTKTAILVGAICTAVIVFVLLVDASDDQEAIGTGQSAEESRTRIVDERSTDQPTPRDMVAVKPPPDPEPKPHDVKPHGRTVEEKFLHLQDLLDRPLKGQEIKDEIVAIYKQPDVVGQTNPIGDCLQWQIRGAGEIAHAFPQIVREFYSFSFSTRAKRRAGANSVELCTERIGIDGHR